VLRGLALGSPVVSSQRFGTMQIPSKLGQHS